MRNKVMLAIINHLFRQTDFEYRRDILALLERNPDAMLLDCGCGNGEFTSRVAGRIGTRKVYGVDIIAGNIAEAKAKGINAWQGDLNGGLPFADETFDIIHANQVIEHLFNTDLFIKEVYRTLKTGGYSLISTPNLASFHNILYLLVGKQPYWVDVSDEIRVNTWHPINSRVKVGIGERPTHYRAFTSGALQELLEYHNFKVEKVIGSGLYPFPVPMAKLLCFIDGKHAVFVTIKARK